MKFSEFQAILGKVSQYTQDAEVVLKDVESGAETVLQSISLELGATTDPTPATVTVNHGKADATPAASSEPTAPGDPAEQPAQPAG